MRIYPQRNCLDRETALRLWTENVTWFSNEEGKKGRIEAGQLADLIVPDRDYLRLRRRARSPTPPPMLTMVGGKIVYGAGDFASLDAAAAAGHAGLVAGAHASAATPPGASRTAQSGCTLAQLAAACGCASACGVHGHDHAAPGPARVPVADLKSFWGALGCSCFAF